MSDAGRDLPDAPGPAGSRLPNLLIIGAQKCGTTTLHATLDQHPDISMSRPKEVQFFTWHWERGPAWYETCFDPAAVRGDATPEYSAFPAWPDVPQRVAALVPDVRLVYLVRDPIERIASHWVHAHGAGREERSLEELVADPSFGRTEFANRTRYWSQAERYLDLFPAEQLLVLSLDLLRTDPVRAVGAVLAHVGLDPADADRLPVVHANQRSEHRRPPWLARRVLQRTGGRRRVRPLEARALAVLRNRFGTPIEPPEITDAVHTRVWEVLGADLDRFADAFPSAATWTRPG